MPLDVMQMRQGAGFGGGGWLGASNPGVLRLPCLVPPHNPKRSVPEPTRGLVGLEEQRYPHGQVSKMTMGQYCRPPTKVSYLPCEWERSALGRRHTVTRTSHQRPD